jgi:membrane protease YdiL (CAAX protease family)
MTTHTLSPEHVLAPAFNWRLFGVLLGMVAFGLVAMIPYGLTTAKQGFSTAMIPQLAAQFMGQMVLYGVLIWIGLKLGQKTGLGAPWLEGWLNGERVAVSAKELGSVLLLGLGAGLAILLLDIYLFAPRLQAELQALGGNVHPPAWQGGLASFYGGIVEEVMLRLFLLTLLAWLGSKVSHTAGGQPTTAVMWLAILISGLVFGIAHLPAASAMGIQLTPLYVLRTLLLNGVGILFGWLYWQRGLESAMLAHFAADVSIHVLGALLLG